MQQRALATAEKYVPWRQDLPWYWVAIEGAIGLLIGIYFIANPDAASSTIRYLVALVLVVASAFNILTGFRNVRGTQGGVSPMTPYLLVRGGAGAAIGVMAIAAERTNDLSDADARKIIGYGLLAYGLIGVVGNIDTFLASQMRWLGLAANALAIILGLVLIYNSRESVDSEKATRYLGYAALVGGGILALYSFLLKTGQDAAADLPVAGPEPPTPPHDLTM